MKSRKIAVHIALILVVICTAATQVAAATETNLLLPEPSENIVDAVRDARDKSAQAGSLENETTAAQTVAENEQELQEKERTLIDHLNYRKTAMENTARATGMKFLPIVLMVAFSMWLASYLFESLAGWTKSSVSMMVFAIGGMLLIYFAYPLVSIIIGKINGS